MKAHLPPPPSFVHPSNLGASSLLPSSPPLLSSKARDGTDIVLRKYLRAKVCKVHDAFDMLQKIIIWRKENDTDGIPDEELGFEFGKAAGRVLKQ